jgi:hypothetical protein
MHKSNFKRFSSAYDLITLRVEPDTVETPQLNLHMLEDLRFWVTGEPKPVTDEPIYMRTTEMSDHIKAEPSTEPDIGEMLVSGSHMRQLGLKQAPTDQSFLLARPDHAEQLERFYL